MRGGKETGEMKCKARQAYWDKAEKRIAREYGFLMLEWIDSVFGVTLSRDPFKWGQKRLQAFYDGGRHEIVTEVEKYTPERMTVKDMGYRDAHEWERVAEGIDTTLERMRKELEYIGFEDAELSALKAEDKFAEKWRETRAILHAARAAWYTANGERATYIYVAGTLLWLHDHCGFGASRLGMVYDKAAPAIRSYTERFLLSSFDEDKRMAKDLDALHAMLEERGIELEELKEEDAVSVKPKTETVTADIPTSYTAETAEFERILEETKKSRLAR